MGRTKKRVEHANKAQDLGENVQINSPGVFETIGNAGVSCIVNVERLEPESDAGYCGQLNLGPDDEHKFLDILAQRFGGPALYHCRPIVRGPDGRMKFGTSQRIRIGAQTIGAASPVQSASMPMAASAIPQPPPIAAPNVMHAASMLAPYGWPYPLPPGMHMTPAPAAQSGPALDPFVMLSKAFELIQKANAGHSNAPVAPPSADDMAKLVQSLSTTVRENAKPDDGFGHLQKALRLIAQLKELQPAEKPAVEDGIISPIWLQMFERIMDSQKPAPVPTQRIPPPPPGYAFNTRTGKYEKLPTAQTARARPPVDDDVVDEEDDDDEVDEDENEEDEDESDDLPQTAESCFTAIERLPVEEQQKLLAMVMKNQSG